MADQSRSLTIPIPIFDGENYDFWRIKIKTVLKAHDLWEVVIKGFVILEDPSTLNAGQRKELKENKIKDARALNILQQALSDTFFPRIAEANNSKMHGKFWKKSLKAMKRYAPLNYKL